MASTKLEVEKFTGENDFHLWRLKMRALLVHQRLDVTLDDESSSKKPMKGTEEELSEVLDRAHSAIILSLVDGVLREMGEGSSITDHIDAFNKIILDLEDINVKIDDDDKAMILLCSLPSSYENLVDTLMYGRQTLAMGDVKEALSSKAAIKKETRDGEWLTARGRTENRETSKNKKKRSKSRPKNLKCFHCHKEGHFKKDCPEFKNKKNNAKEKNEDAAVVSEFEESDGYDLARVLIATDAQTKGNWVLDSGCSFHMCPNKTLFTNYETCDGGIVVMGNDLTCRVVGRGSIRLKMFDGMSKELRDVRHVPDLKRNLISLGMLDKIGCLVKLESGTLKVLKGSMVVMKGNMSNGKSSRVKFSTGIHNSKGTLDYIHADLWGPAQTASLGGARTPYELWSGKPADYSQLRIFGCPAYAHVKQGKLEPRAFKCVFLGYHAGVKGYKLWCTDMKPPRAIISRDMVFNEHEMLQNSATENQTIERMSGCDKKSFLEVELPSSSTEADKKARPENSPGIDFPEQQGELEGDDNLRNYQLVRDRKKRESKPPKRYAYADLIAFALSTEQGVEEDEPKTYTEAVSSKDSKKWVAAMDEEMRSLIKNHTWDLIPKPEKKKVVGYKWIYKIKEGIPVVEPLRYKARLVAKGFTQKEGADFNETAFLHGELEEMIVMAQPRGYEDPAKADYVCHLRKSLYGLKQSLRQWYLRFDKFMAENSFQRCSYDCYAYHKDLRDGGKIYLLLYVDDMLIACNHMDQIDKLKKQLKNAFEMKDLGAAKKILGVELLRDSKKGILKLSQHCYIKKILERFEMVDSKPVQTPLSAHFRLSCNQCPRTEDEKAEMSTTPYSSAVGCLMYAMVLTRPDISHAVSVVSRYMANPGKEHWRAVKWILRYLSGIADYGLIYSAKGGTEVDVEGYVDADYAGDLDKRSVVALSTTEAEYTAAAEAFKEAIWLRGIVTELGFEQRQVAFHCDSQSAICLSKNQVHHEKTKHIDVKLHFVRLEVSKGMVKLLKVHTDDNLVDMLTKAILAAKLEFCMNSAGICRL
ncbi:hypothetical protein KPL70_021322 [Citrus sinensis]|nr:hypothetical protein KPL70_021322 [Citrus sinensis]